MALATTLDPIVPQRDGAFFWNTTGVLAPEAAVAFRELGLTEAAELLEEAMGWFDPPYPRERAVRMQLISELEEGAPDPWSELQTKFYASLPGWTFENAADEFARRHFGEGSH